ncbi:MAG: tRNA pseudouridine(55) synthase TruB [Chloroflexota bacterium]
MGRAEPDAGEGLVTGVLNVNKPGGWTSHDVVAKLRRIVGQRRMGHAGTLDPLATGVLLVCLGRATRVTDYLADAAKTYEATLRLGLSTDTWDADGEIVAEWPVPAFGLDELEAALAPFRGPIAQVPPIYSALKRDGQPLYRLARKGIEVNLAPRPVEIYRLQVVAWQSPDLTLAICCSKGTYVRSLANDLGAALGTGAHVAALSRTAVGPFTLADAASLAALIDPAAPQAWQRHLLPLERALAHLPRVEVDAEAAQRLRVGAAVPLDLPPDPAPRWAYDDSGRLIAIVQPSAAPGLWRPVKVLVG